MDDPLNIQEPIEFDERIAHIEIQAYQPASGVNYNNNDEIKFQIQQQRVNLWPSRSKIHISGRLCTPDNQKLKSTNFVNNGICFLFENIFFKLNEVDIDQCQNVGLNTLMKTWPSLDPNKMKVIENAGWTGLSKEKITNDDGYFDVCIPLSMLLGFAEDYRKLIVNMRLELILNRASNDLNAVVQTATDGTFEEFQINITKIEWLMPHVTLSSEKNTQLLKFLEKDRMISMSFRSRDFFSYPLLPLSTYHSWVVKTSTQLEKPRFVIIGLQTNRKAQKDKDASLFDHCNLSNVKLRLNSKHYPYINLNINIAQNNYSIIYDMFGCLQNVLYEKDIESSLTKKEFIEKVPLIIIDCSKQDDSLKNAPVDVSIELESRANFPENTAAYCEIIHDRIIQYNSIRGLVKKVV